MYVSSKNNNMQEAVKRSKMITFFNTLMEHDKDIVIAMAKSLVERNKGNKNSKPYPIGAMDKNGGL
jgi:hypothetical protein